MTENLFIVTDAFTIKGRGTVLTGNIAQRIAATLQAGDAIEIRKDGQTVERTRIADLKMPDLSSPPGLGDCTINLLINSAQARMTLKGSEVWKLLS